jgi:hypothetical protein
MGENYVQNHVTMIFLKRKICLTFHLVKNRTGSWSHFDLDFITHTPITVVIDNNKMISVTKTPDINGFTWTRSIGQVK